MEKEVYKLQEGRVHTMKEYRLIEGIGGFWNKQYKVQEKYSYYENGEKVYNWHTLFTSPDRKRCEVVLARRQSQ